MAEIWMRRRGLALVPGDEISAGSVDRIKPGVDVLAEIKVPRNGKFHRFFFVLVNRIAQAVDVNPEALRQHLTVKAGHVNVVKTRGGIMEYPASISWAKMDENDFRDFFERCVRIIYEDFGIARPEVLDAVSDLLAPDARAA